MSKDPQDGSENPEDTLQQGFQNGSQDPPQDRPENCLLNRGKSALGPNL